MTPSIRCGGDIPAFAGPEEATVPSVAVMHVPRPTRTKGQLSLAAPAGELNGVNLELYIRAGTEAGHHFVGPAPRDYVGPISQDIDDADLTAADDVFVDATVVVKAPAQLDCTVVVSGVLTVTGKSSPASATIVISAGTTAAIGTLTWWVEP